MILTAINRIPIFCVRKLWSYGDRNENIRRKMHIIKMCRMLKFNIGKHCCAHQCEDFSCLAFNSIY